MADLSKLSDAELTALYSQKQAAVDPSKMTDDELKAAYAAKPGSLNQPQQSLASEIGTGLTNAVKSAGSSVADYLNPFSDARHASYEKQASLPLGEGIKENLKQVLGTGSAMATPVTAPGEAFGAVATPLVARPFQAVNNALGIDLPYEQAKEQAGTALMGMRPKGFSPAGPRAVPAPTPSAAELKASGKSVYNDPAVKTAPIPTSDVTALTAKLNNDLTYQGFRPSTGSAPSTFAELERIKPPSGATVTVDDMRAARRALNMTAAQKDQFGKPTPDAVAAGHSIRQIDDLLDNFAPALKGANADYAAAKQAEQLDYRRIKADHRAAKTGSGSNIENTMRQEVDKIPDRGLTAEERALRDRIVEGDFTRNSLRKVGKLGFSDGLSLVLHAGAALPSGGLSTAIGGGATVARKVGEALTRRQISQLSEMIRSRAPSSQNLPMVMPSRPGASGVAAALLADGRQQSMSALAPSHAGQDDKSKKAKIAALLASIGR